MSISSRDRDGIYQRKINEICKAIGFESEYKDKRLLAVIDAAEKLVFDKNSTPLSDNESDKRRTADPDYDKYLLDAAPFDTSKIAPTKEQPKLPSVFEHFQEHPCPYRAIVKEKSGSFSVYCDTKKLPAEVCITRQKRYLHFDRNCRPESKAKKPRRPRPYTPKYSKSKFSMGDNEGTEPNYSQDG